MSNKKQLFFLLGLVELILVGLALLFGNSSFMNYIMRGTKEIPEVLQATTKNNKLAGDISFNLPSRFNEDVLVDSNATVSGTLTAPNIIYGLIAGQNIAISGGQTPTISASFSGVASFQGQTGELTLAAGDGIAINGLTITNDDPGSAQTMFSNIKINGTTLTAGSNKDTFELVPGSGIGLSTNTSGNQITITNTSTASNPLSGLTTNGVLYADSSSTATSLTPGTSGYILQSNGSGSAPSWVPNSSGGAISVSESGTTVVATLDDLNFLGGDFDVSESPSGTANVQLASTLTSVTGVAGAFTTGTTLSVGTSLILGGDTVSDITGSGLAMTSNSLGINLTTTGTTGATSSNSGLEVSTSGLTLLKGCSDMQILQWNDGTSLWECATASGGGTNFWQRNNGAVAPAVLSNDLLLGDTATASAKFGFINVASGTPTATISAGTSGGIYITATGNIATTANQALTIGGATTGDIILSPNGGSNKVNSTGTLNLASGKTYQINNVDVLSATTLGSSVIASSLTSVGALNSGSITSGFGSIDIGGDNLTAGGTITFSGLTTNGGLLYTNGTGVVAQTAAGSAGQCLISNGGGAPSWTTCPGSSTANYWQLNNGTVSPFSNTLDLLVGGTASSSAKFAVLNVNSGTPTASVSAGTNGAAYLTADGTLQTTANQNLTLGGSTTGNITLSPLNGSGTVTSTGNLNLASGKVFQINGTSVLSNNTLGSGVLTSSLTTVGALNSGSITSGFGSIDIGGDALTAGGTITFSGLTTNGGLLYTNGSGTVAQTTAGSAGQCLLSNGGGAPSWGSCDGVGTSYWTLANGALYASNTTTDLLVGGAASSSAKFAILNVNSGTPTASLSAGVSGGLYLNASGNLQTTNNQTLSLGGATTGNLSFAAGNGSGNLAISTGSLSINGSTGATAASPTCVSVTNGIVTGTGTCGTGSGGSVWTLNATNGTLYPINNTLDVLFGGTATASAKFGFLNVNSGTPTASVSAGTNGAAYITADGTLQTTANQNLTLGGSTTGNITLSPLNGSGTVLSTGSLNLASGKVFQINGTAVLSNNTLGSGVLTSSLTTVGALNSGSITSGFGAIDIGADALTAGGTITFSGLTTNGGLLYTNGTGVVAQTTAGSGGQCLISNGGGAPSWTTCPGSSTANYWQLNNGTVSPFSNTLDLLVGGTASTSAKFAVLNVNSGTPTASLSAGTAGGSYITADGTLQTTANQNFTLGGSTTGNITLSPLNGSGTVTSTGNVNLASGKVFQINGTSVLSNNTLGTGVLTSSLTTVGALNAGSITSGFGAIDIGADALTAGGTITFSGLTTNGGLLYTNGTGVVAQTTAGSAGQCLQSNGGGAPTWSTCDAASAGYWSLANGALYTSNNSTDLLVGGTASTSAKFAVLNVNSGTPTASVSAGSAGGSYLTADGKLATTAKQTLTLGDSTTTGNVIINPSGKIGIGNSSPVGKLDLAGAATGKALAIFNETGDQNIFTASASGTTVLNLDRSGNLALEGALSDLSGTSLAINDALQVLSTNESTFASSETYLYLQPVTTSDTVGYVRLGGYDSNGTSGARDLALQPSGGNVGIGNTSPTSMFSVGSSSQFQVNSSGAIAAATGITSSGTITFSGLTTNGGLLYTNGTGVVAQTAAGTGAQCLLGGTAPAWGTCGLGTNYWNATSGALSPINSTLDLLVGGTASTSAKFKISPSGTSPTASVSGATSFAGTVIDQSGLGDLFTASKSGATKFSILNNGNISFAGTTNFLNTISTAATAARSYVMPDASGTVCLQSSANCGFGLGTNYWNATSGALAPINSTLDMLVGGTASTSAKFAVLNVNSGTPTASLSAGASGGSYFTAAGTMQTTNNQLLTIGGNTTGNIALNPLNGAGTVTVDGGLVASGTSGEGFSGAGLTDCDASGSKLLWDATSKLFSCGTDRASVTVNKASDQTNATSTLVSDSDFTFPVGAGETWVFQINANVSISSASDNLTFAVNGPASTTCKANVSNIYALQNSTTTDCDAAPGVMSITNGTTQGEQFIIWASVTTTNSGTITLKWARASGSSTMTMIAGSFMTAYKVNGADLAEAYYSKDSSIEPGDVVMVDGSLKAGVQKTAKPYDSRTMGIVSTQPGHVLGDDTQGEGKMVLLALAGRVPVKVTSENGPIEPGDYLTTSSTPGVAMKATKPGQVIGKAMEAYDNADKDAIGKVMVFTNLSWADPSMHFAANGEFVAESIDNQPAPQASGNAGLDLSSLSASVSALKDTQDEHNAKIDSLESKVASLQAMSPFPACNALACEAGRSVLGSQFSASSSAELGLDSLDANDITVSNSLSVMGKTTLNDLGVTGNITAGVISIHGLEGELNTLAGPLKLQSNGINGIDLIDGKVTIATNGDIETKGALTAKKLNIDTTDVLSASLGEAVLPEGKTMLKIDTAAVTSTSAIFITPKTKTSLPISVTQQTPGKSFKVEIESSLDKDIKFNWWIVN